MDSFTQQKALELTEKTKDDAQIMKEMEKHEG